MNRPPFFYGWVIVVMTFLVQFLVMGSGFYIFGVLLKPLTEALGTDRFLVSIGISLQMVTSAAIGPWLGGAIGRYDIRLLLTAGVLLMAIGLAGVSFATALWHFYLAFSLVLSAGFALAGPVPNAALIANWFVVRRGTAMGFSQLGVTLSGALLVPLFTWLMLAYDWRVALQFFAVAMPLVAMPVIWFGVVKTPEESGLHPDGSDHPIAMEGGETTTWTMRRAIGDIRVWQIVLVIGPGFVGVSAVVLSIHSHLTDGGLTAMSASAVVAAMTLMGALAKPLFGVLTDMFNKKLVMLLSIVLMILGVGGLILLESYTALLVAAGMFGLGYGAQMPLFNILTATMFGRSEFAAVLGLMMPMMLPFNLLGLPLTTLIYESMGSYLPAYTGLIVLYVFAASCLFFLRLPKSTTVPAADTESDPA